MLLWAMENQIHTNYKPDRKETLGATLIGDFVGQKTASYIEPERKGTAKGDEIGFSQKKYEASLWNITSLKLRILAILLGISHGLLRKWRTEEKFKKMIAQHCREFAEYFCNFIEELVAKELEFDKTGRPSDQEYKTYLLECERKVNNGAMYGSQLCENIREILEIKIAGIEKRKKHGDENPGDEIYMDMVERVLTWSKIDLSSKIPSLNQILDRIKIQEKEYVLSVLEQHMPLYKHQDPIALFKKVVTGEHLSDEERQDAIRMLEIQLLLLKHHGRIYAVVKEE